MDTLTPLGLCELCGAEKITQNEVPMCVKCGDRRNVSGGVFDEVTRKISPLVVGEKAVTSELAANYKEVVEAPAPKLNSMDACLDAILGIIEQMPMPKTAKQFNQINKFKQTILKIKEGNDNADKHGQ